MIQVDRLTKQLGDTKVLKGISFSMPERAVTGLLGPNGAGKTTTIKILATLLAPTSGSVLIDGLDIVEQAHEIRAKIGYLPEDPPLYKELTVLEQLKLSGALYGLSGKKLNLAIRSSLERCQLGDVSNQFIFKLSKGFQQRVGIAQTILHNPTVVILDEPTNGLDPLQLIEARGIIHSLAETATVMFSSHLMQEVVEVCSKVVLIAGGEKLLESDLDRSTGREILEKQFVQAISGAM